MATSNIPNVISDAINNCSRVDYRILDEEASRSTGNSGTIGTVTLNKGVYIALSQTTTTNYTGRTYCDYYDECGGVISNTDFMPPLMPTNYGNCQIVQLIIVKSNPATITRRYWDTQSTGAKHVWQIFRIL